MNSRFDQGALTHYKEVMKDQITEAALRLAARQDWAGVELADIAKEAGIALAELRDVIACKDDIIGLLFERLDKQMLAATTFEGAPKDRLFDVFMARFDAMNGNRDAFLSILRSVKTDPSIICRILPHAYASMGWAMNAAGIDAQGWKAKPARLALVTVIVSAMRAWVEDDTPDMSAVMAKLDQGLEKISKLLT